MKRYIKCSEEFYKPATDLYAAWREIIHAMKAGTTRSDVNDYIKECYEAGLSASDCKDLGRWADSAFKYWKVATAKYNQSDKSMKDLYNDLLEEFDKQEADLIISIIEDIDNDERDTPLEPDALYSMHEN